MLNGSQTDVKCRSDEGQMEVKWTLNGMVGHEDESSMNVRQKLNGSLMKVLRMSDRSLTKVKWRSSTVVTMASGNARAIATMANDDVRIIVVFCVAMMVGDDIHTVATIVGGKEIFFVFFIQQLQESSIASLCNLRERKKKRKREKEKKKENFKTYFRIRHSPFGLALPNSSNPASVNWQKCNNTNSLQ
jgi:hypothetical protein